MYVLTIAAAVILIMTGIALIIHSIKEKEWEYALCNISALVCIVCTFILSVSSHWAWLLLAVIPIGIIIGQIPSCVEHFCEKNSNCILILAICVFLVTVFYMASLGGGLTDITKAINGPPEIEEATFTLVNYEEEKGEYKITAKVNDFGNNVYNKVKEKNITFSKTAEDKGYVTVKTSKWGYYTETYYNIYLPQN